MFKFSWRWTIRKEVNKNLTLQIKRRDLWWRYISLDSRKQNKTKQNTSGNYFVSLADIEKTWSAGKRIRKSKKASWALRRMLDEIRKNFNYSLVDNHQIKTNYNYRLWQMHEQWEYSISTLMEYCQGYLLRNIHSL